MNSCVLCFDQLLEVFHVMLRCLVSEYFVIPPKDDVVFLQHRVEMDQPFLKLRELGQRPTVEILQVIIESESVEVVPDLLGLLDRGLIREPIVVGSEVGPNLLDLFGHHTKVLLD